MSPTLPEGRKVKGDPEPNINGAINPLALAIASGYTFVARTQSYNVKEMADIMLKAIQHKGLALVDILQGCPTYNEEFTSAPWFSIHTKELPKDYDPVVKNPNDLNEVNNKRLEAIKIVLSETPDNMYRGIFFQWENPDTFESRLLERGLKPPISQQISDKDGKPIVDLDKVIKQLIV